MKPQSPLLFLTLLAALLRAPAPAAAPSSLPEPGPFQIMPSAALEPMIFHSDRYYIFAAIGMEWNEGYYMRPWPVEFEHPVVSLAQPFSLSAEAFHQQIHSLYRYPYIEAKLPASQPGNGKFNFNIGYTF